MLASVLAARHVGSESRSVEVRLGFLLTDTAEKALVVEYMRALIVGALLSNRTEPDTSGIDSCAANEITEDKLAPLMQGEIVASHRGTEDAGWLCAVEFSAPNRSGRSSWCGQLVHAVADGSPFAAPEAAGVCTW